MIAMVVLVASGALSIATEHLDQTMKNSVGTQGNAAWYHLLQSQLLLLLLL